MTTTPTWWHDPDRLYTVLRDLLKGLWRRASIFDPRRTQRCLLLAGMHLGRGPLRYAEDVDAVDEVSFETGLVLVNHMLARLQELSREPPARVIRNVHIRVNEICDPLELEWFAPEDPEPDDDQ